MRNMLLYLIVAIMASKTAMAFEPVISNQIHLLRPRTGSNIDQVDGVTSCLSWRFGVETNNVIGWETIPMECEQYVGHYMLGSQYRKDSKVVTEAAFLHANSFNISATETYAWVFDVDETVLSNLPYYATIGFGALLFNGTLFVKWVMSGEALALPESLKLYEKLVTLGMKVFFLTGRAEAYRNVTEANLKSAGYHYWERVILRGSEYEKQSVVAYKSAERKKIEDEGYELVGNMGDQWSDLLGNNPGNRTFKLPDPIYYIS